MLQIEQLKKHYVQGGELIHVLDEIDLTLDAGETLAITGASGSGKSTLLHLIAGLDRADEGQIKFMQQSLHNASETELDAFRRQQLGLVYQRFNLTDCLTVSENIELPVYLKRMTPEPDYVTGILAALDLTGLDQRYPWQLSGGQQQRVAIARALAHQPALLLADEPTGNLDDEHSEQVADLLFSMCHQHNSGLILVTHSQSIANRADRRLHLRNGRLAH